MESFEQIANRLGKLLDEKNKNYGSAYLTVPRILGILYPNGIRPEEYIPCLLTIRILDKICRISQGAMNDSFLDIAGYGILGEHLQQIMAQTHVL
jgi:hypothetical protein